MIATKKEEAEAKMEIPGVVTVNRLREWKAVPVTNTTKSLAEIDWHAPDDSA